MKYYRLHIDSKNDYLVYQKITEILNVKPTVFENEKDIYSIWTYAFDEDYKDTNYDFINEFLNIAEPHFAELQKIGIKKQDILIWLNYEYDQQCAMEFHPEEMKRLGESGIGMNIDCFQIKPKT